MKRHFFVKITFILALFTFDVAGQSYTLYNYVTDTLKINLQNKYKLNSAAVIPYSESIVLRDKKLNREDYKIEYSRSQFSLSDSLTYSIFDTLFVTYQTIKLDLKKEYSRRKLVVVYNNALKDSIQIVKSVASSLTPESIFGKNMQKSGTLIRGFTVGTTKDFSLSSGLRLQLSGNLSDNISIVAALTDENTPIQPEGNTERLEELDKVFIQIKHPYAVGTFGDYQLYYNNTEFNNLQRKLQGLKGDLNFKNHSASIAVAGSRGKFNSNQFSGIDGVQGPYRLQGLNNENDIIVIAGSERVYLDGEPLKRGQNNDYTIEYSNAEITFTTKRIITSASRIYVDFEYTDRQFKRNFFGANYNGEYFDGGINLNLVLAREGDDKNSPIDITISDEERKILEAAGDDRLKAVVSGVSLAEPDSNGVRRGLYERRTDISNGDTTVYYYYNPGGADAVYNVAFTHLSPGFGTYNRIAVGNFVYVGEGKGSYLPVKLLPVPQRKQSGGIRLGINPWRNLSITAEFSASDWDKNTFSNLDSEDNLGYARSVEVKMSPDTVSIGKLSLGKIGFSYKDRFIQNKFSSLDRINNVEFNRYYNIDRNLKADEYLREARIDVSPVKYLNIKGLYGAVSKGAGFNSKRYKLSADLKNNDDYSLRYNFDFVSSLNSGRKTDWSRQNGEGFYRIGKFRPGVFFLSEKKEAFAGNSDSLNAASLEYLEAGPTLGITDIFGLSVVSKFTYREESFPIDGVMFKESEALTHGYNIKYRGLKEFTTNFDIAYRTKKYTDAFKKQGRLNSETVLIRNTSRFNFFGRFASGDLFYEAATEKSAKLQKVFIRVRKGTGNYKYLGDLNNNGIADENEFEPTIYDGDFIRVTIPTDELFPVINLKFNNRWIFDFKKIVKSNSLIGSAIKSISTETVWRIEENSSEPDLSKIYFLNFNHFLNDSTTIKGSNFFQNDIHIFKNKTDFSVRFRYSQRENLNQYNDGIERGYYKERSVRIRFRMVKEISNQTDFINTVDNNSAPASSNRSRLLSGNELSSDFSYRPINNLEFGFKISVARNRDDFPSQPTVIDRNTETARLTLSFAGKGRLRFEAERSELTSNTLDNYIPFEITKGNNIGKNYFWKLKFDYRFTNNLQASVNYDGRVQAGSKVVNTLRAEARAYF